MTAVEVPLTTRILATWARLNKAISELNIEAATDELHIVNKLLDQYFAQLPKDTHAE